MWSRELDSMVLMGPFHLRYSMIHQWSVASAWASGWTTCGRRWADCAGLGRTNGRLTSYLQRCCSATAQAPHYSGDDKKKKVAFPCQGQCWRWKLFHFQQQKAFLCMQVFGWRTNTGFWWRKRSSQFWQTGKFWAGCAWSMGMTQCHQEEAAGDNGWRLPSVKDWGTHPLSRLAVLRSLLLAGRLDPGCYGEVGRVLLVCGLLTPCHLCMWAPIGP